MHYITWRVTYIPFKAGKSGKLRTDGIYCIMFINFTLSCLIPEYFLKIVNTLVSQVAIDLVVFIQDLKLFLFFNLLLPPAQPPLLYRNLSKGEGSTFHGRGVEGFLPLPLPQRKKLSFFHLPHVHLTAKIFILNNLFCLFIFLWF